MTKSFPVLVLLLGLGSSFSFAHSGQSDSSFDNYILTTRANRFEPVLSRVASKCGVRLALGDGRFAERPENAWKPVRQLANGRKDQETDFFSTAAVWGSRHRAVVELWWMNSEAGDETRTLYCLHDGAVLQGEQIEWASPQQQDSSSKSPVWAYEVRWKVAQNKLTTSTLERFVDARERPIAKPKYGDDVPKTFGLIPQVFEWTDLKLPDELLK
jgi:hypothetical protein